MLRLDRIDGPECPECGCTDSELLEVQERTGMRIDSIDHTRIRLVAKTEHRRCSNCRSEIWIRGGWEPVEPEAKPAPMLIDEPRRDGRICPRCGAPARQTKATSKNKGVQYRKCRVCGENFKNIIHG